MFTVGYGEDCGVGAATASAAKAAALMAAVIMLAGCDLMAGQAGANYSDSGIYGHAYSIAPGTTVENFSPAASSGHYFNIETADRSGLVATVVVRADGSFRANLQPGFYFIDTGDRDPIHALVWIRPQEYLRTDLLLSQ